MTQPSTERVRRFRERAKSQGWTTVEVKVPTNRVDDVRAFAQSLGEPAPQVSPNQGFLFPDLVPE